MMMPTVSHIYGMRKRLSEKSQHKSIERIAIISSCFISFSLAVAVIFIALVYAEIATDLPEIESLATLIEENNPTKNPTRFYDREGERLLLSLRNPDIQGANYLGIQNDSEIDIEALKTEQYLPENIILATIATNDPYFWKHPGFNIHPGYITGHPSIAQRIVRDFLLTDEKPGLLISLRERLLAAQITSHFGRQKIIEYYLNSNYYGNLAYGIDAASRLYLGKPATELNLAEAALLAGVSKSPALNPLDTPEIALENQKYVIQDMLNKRLISPGEGVLAAQHNIILPAYEKKSWIFEGGEIAPAFLLKAIEQLKTQIPQERFLRGGYIVTTTLDDNIQTQATCIAMTQLERITSNRSIAAKTDSQCEGEHLLPLLLEKIELPVENINTEIMLIDSKTGQILALTGLSSGAGAIDYFPTHSLGSSATPFIYLTAFAHGMSPASLVWDIPPELGSHSLQNFNNEYYGPQRLRNAFANDYLTPAQTIMNQVGRENVWRTAESFGIQFPDLQTISSEASLEMFGDFDLPEITHAYSVFANQGVLSGQILDELPKEFETNIKMEREISSIEPATILKVTDLENHTLIDWNKPQTQPIITPQLSYLVTHVLSDETARWQSMGHPNALEIDRPAAAKVGRSENGNSYWTLGYLPEYTLGVWLGLGNSQTEISTEKQIDYLQQATMGLWHAVFRYYSNGLAYYDFSAPAGISDLKVCDPSGLLPTEVCPNVVDEVFLAGNEPIQNDTLYKEIQTNRLTNRIATVFTPPDVVESRTFMLIPEEAKKWAQQAGIEIPPEEYDSIPSEMPSWSHSQINSPTPFEILRGEVPIIGNATGERLDFHRVEIGSGLNPQFWYQIGEDSNQPVSNQKLATWDTTGLNGLYAIQLLVVQEERSVERSTTLVTIDNLPPKARIINPLPGEIILQSELTTIVFQADIEDELGIEQAAFYLNNKLIKNLYQPPYAVSWNTKVGSFTLLVEVKDLAGNTSQDSITFQVK